MDILILNAHVKTLTFEEELPQKKHGLINYLGCLKQENKCKGRQREILTITLTHNSAFTCVICNNGNGYIDGIAVIIIFMN